MADVEVLFDFSFLSIERKVDDRIYIATLRGVLDPKVVYNGIKVSRNLPSNVVVIYADTCSLRMLTCDGEYVLAASDVADPQTGRPYYSEEGKEVLGKLAKRLGISAKSVNPETLRRIAKIAVRFIGKDGSVIKFRGIDANELLILVLPVRD